AAVSGEYDVFVFDLSKRVRVARLHHDGSVLALAFSGDGRRIATSAYDELVHVWEAATGKEVFGTELKGPADALAFSPDSKQLVASSSGTWGTQSDLRILDA